jgi:hypothetical protein
MHQCTNTKYPGMYSRGVSRAMRSRRQKAAGARIAARTRVRGGRIREELQPVRTLPSTHTRAKCHRRGRTQIAAFNSGMELSRVLQKMPCASTRRPMGSAPISSHPPASGTSSSSTTSRASACIEYALPRPGPFGARSGHPARGTLNAKDTRG